MGHFEAAVRAFATGALVVLLVLGTSACQASAEETATFEGPWMTFQAGADLATMKVRIVREDGREVTAECLIRDIPTRSPVTVKQDTDGTWVVTGTANPTIADEVNMKLDAERGEDTQEALSRLRQIALGASRFNIIGTTDLPGEGEHGVRIEFGDGSSLVLYGLRTGDSDGQSAQYALERVYVTR